MIGSVRFGWVRFGKLCFLVRRGSTCVFRLRLGSVRFVSASYSRINVPAGSRINDSVRFDSAGSVRFLIPSCHMGVSILQVVPKILADDFFAST